MKKRILYLLLIFGVFFAFDKVYAEEMFVKIFSVDDLVTVSEGVQISSNDEIIIVSGNKLLKVGTSTKSTELDSSEENVTINANGTITPKASFNVFKIEGGTYDGKTLEAYYKTTDSSSSKDVYLYPKTKTTMFRTDTKKSKIVKLDSGYFQIRVDKTGFLYYGDTGWDVTTDNNLIKVEIFKKVSDYEEKKIIIYDSKDEEKINDYVGYGGRYVLPDYSSIGTVPEKKFFKGWAKKGDTSTIYKPGDTVIVTEKSAEYVPVFVDITEQYVMDDNLILGRFGEDSMADPYEGLINVYYHYGLNESPKKYQLKYHYKDNNTIDIIFKFLTSEVNDEKYKSIEEFVNDTKQFSSYDYVITKVLVTQNTKSSTIKKEYNFVTANGGMLDNVEGSSDVHIYLSKKYSTKYYDGDKLIDSLSINDHYIIDSKDYLVVDGFEEAKDGNTINGEEYVDPKDKVNYFYLPDLSDYETVITLPKKESNEFWTLNDKEVKESVNINDIVNEIENTDVVFQLKRKNLLGIENPKTGITTPYVILSLVVITSCVLIIAYRKKDYIK